MVMEFTSTSATSNHSYRASIFPKLKPSWMMESCIIFLLLYSFPWYCSGTTLLEYLKHGDLSKWHNEEKHSERKNSL